MKPTRTRPTSKIKIETVADAIAKAGINDNERDKGNQKLLRYLCKLAQQSQGKFSSLLVMLMRLHFPKRPVRRRSSPVRANGK